MPRRRRRLSVGGMAPAHRRYQKKNMSFKRSVNGFLQTVIRPFAAIGLLFEWPKRKHRPAGTADAAICVPAEQSAAAVQPAPVQKAPLPPKAPLPKWVYWSVAGFAVLFMAASGWYLKWAIRYSDTSIPVSITADGVTTNLSTKAETVGDIMEALSLTLTEGDTMSHDMDDPLTAGMHIAIQRAFPVAVASGETVTVLNMQEGSVEDAFEAANIDYDSDDILTELPFADVTPGMGIRHISVETQYETATKDIEYDEKVIKDSSRYTGDDEIKVEGELGSRLIVRQLVFQDGVQTSGEIMNQIILKEPVDEVKIVGTKFRAQTNLTGDKRPYKAAPKKGEYVDVIVAEDVTAYTHTGRKTATGKWPKVGYVAVNPNVIPYGTYMYIKGYGYCYAQDTGAFRHEDGGTKNQIDLFMETEKECRKWGRKHNVNVYIIKWGR